MTSSNKTNKSANKTAKAEQKEENHENSQDNSSLPESSPIFSMLFKPSNDPASELPIDLQEVLQTILEKEEQEAVFLDERSTVLKRIPVANLYEELGKIEEKVTKIVFDGIITQRLIDLCLEKEISVLVGAKATKLPKKVRLQIFTFQ